jgi:hypothetical protein
MKNANQNGPVTNIYGTYNTETKKELVLKFFYISFCRSEPTLSASVAKPTTDTSPLLHRPPHLSVSQPTGHVGIIEHVVLRTEQFATLSASVATAKPTTDTSPPLHRPPSLSLSQSTGHKGITELIVQGAPQLTGSSVIKKRVHWRK